MPHSMKNCIVCSLAILSLAVALVSCNTKSTYSPGLHVYPTLQRTSAAGVQDSITLKDSLNIGDTVRMTMIVDAYFDYLQSVIAKTDTEKVKVSLAWNEEQMDMLAQEADLAHGKLIFAPMRVPACVTVLTYVPVKEGSHTVHIDITSSAESPYSSNSWSFGIGVRAPLP